MLKAAPMSRVQTQAITNLAVRPANGALTPEQLRVVRTIRAATQQLDVPRGIALLRRPLQCIQRTTHRLFAMHYPIDVRVLEAPAANMSFAPQHVVLLGAGYVLTLKTPAWQALAADVAQAFPQLGIPDWHFRDYPWGIRHLFAATARLWYGGLWEGNFRRPWSPNPFVQAVRAVAAARGTVPPIVRALDPDAR